MYSPRRLADTFTLDRLNALYRAPINRKPNANSKLNQNETKRSEISDSIIQNIKQTYPKIFEQAHKPNENQTKTQLNISCTSNPKSDHIEKTLIVNPPINFKPDESKEKHENFNEKISNLHIDYLKRINNLEQKVFEQFQNMKNEIAKDIRNEEMNWYQTIKNKPENLKTKRNINDYEKILIKRREIIEKENFVGNKTYSSSAEREKGDSFKDNSKSYTKPILQSELITTQNLFKQNNKIRSSSITPNMLNKESILKPNILNKDAKNKDIWRIPIQSINSTKYSTYYR